MYPWSCCHFSILLTAFSSSIRCLVKLCTFAEFTSLITIWDSITEDCVLSLNSFLKRQENPLWCCWGSLFIIQLLSLSTALPLNSTRKTVNCLGFGVFFVLILTEGGTYLTPFWQKYLSLLLSFFLLSLPDLFFQIIFFPKGKRKVWHLSLAYSLPPTLDTISACVHYKLH